MSLWVFPIFIMCDPLAAIVIPTYQPSLRGAMKWSHYLGYTPRFTNKLKGMVYYCVYIVIYYILHDSHAGRSSNVSLSTAVFNVLVGLSLFSAHICHFSHPCCPICCCPICSFFIWHYCRPPYFSPLLNMVSHWAHKQSHESANMGHFDG